MKSPTILDQASITSVSRRRSRSPRRLHQLRHELGRGLPAVGLQFSLGETPPFGDSLINRHAIAALRPNRERGVAVIAEIRQQTIYSLTRA